MRGGMGLEHRLDLTKDGGYAGEVDAGPGMTRSRGGRGVRDLPRGLSSREARGGTDPGSGGPGRMAGDEFQALRRHGCSNSLQQPERDERPEGERYRRRSGGGRARQGPGGAATCSRWLDAHDAIGIEERRRWWMEGAETEGDGRRLLVEAERNFGLGARASGTRRRESAGWVEKDREGIPRGFGRVAAEGTGGWDKAPRI